MNGDTSGARARCRRRALLSIASIALFGSVLSAGHQPCEWEEMEGGGFNSAVFALASFGEKGMHDLYAGGTFRESLGSPASRIARWSSGEWGPLGSSVAGVVRSLAELDNGSGSALYVGGTFGRAGEIPDANGVARWDGSEWSALGAGLRNETPVSGHIAAAMIVFDDGAGPALYVGGAFTEAGGVAAKNIARWDGQEWSALGEGVGDAGSVGVRALAVFDDGSGPALYAGGYFLGGVARWDGESWSNVGQPVGVIDAMAVFDDGTGPALYAGGQMHTSSGHPGDGLARWDGKRWAPVGGGVDYDVRSMHVFDDGTGPALYVGGAFSTAGGKDAWGIAKWDGHEWHDLDGGVYGSVDAMTTFDDGTGPALYVAGSFDFAGVPGGILVENIARWRCERACYPDCDSSGDLTFFDFLCFQNEFAAGSSYGDCDGNGGHDFFDLLCFHNEFAAGCG